MVAYLRARLSELSTWLGLALLAAILICAAVWGPRVWSWVGVTVGSFMAGLPGRVLRAGIEAAADLAGRANTYDSGIEPAHAAGAALPKEFTMALSFQQILTDAPDFVKLVQDGITIEQAIEKNGWLATLPSLIQYQADAEKVFADIQALVAQPAAA